MGMGTASGPDGDFEERLENTPRLSLASRTLLAVWAMGGRIGDTGLVSRRNEGASLAAWLTGACARAMVLWEVAVQL